LGPSVPWDIGIPEPRQAEFGSLTVRLPARKDPIRMSNDLALYIRVVADPAT